MDFTKPVNAPRPKRRGLRALAWIVGVLCVLVALVLALPALLSTGAVRGLVLGKVNDALAPASVEIADWDFAWFGEQALEGIRYRDPRQGIDARVKRVRLGALSDLLPVGKMTVAVEVDTPEVTYAPPSPAPAKPEAGGEPAPAPAPTASPAEKAPILLPAWEVSVSLAVTNASFAMAGLPAPLATVERASVEMASFDAPIAVAAKGAAQGVTFGTEVVLPSARELTAAKAINDFFTSAAATLDAPWLAVKVAADAHKGAAWPAVKAEATVDLPGALAFAASFGVKAEGLEVKSGKLSLSAEAGTGKAPGALAVSANLGTQNLACAVQGKPLALDPKVALAAEVDPANPLAARIETLTLALPGVSVQGQGTMGNGALAAKIETTPLLEALRPFVGEVALPGPLTVALEAKSAQNAFGMAARVQAQTKDLLALTAKAGQVDAQALAVGSLQVGVTSDLSALTAYLGVPGLKKGTFYLNTKASGSPKAVQADVTFALRDVAYAAAPLAIAEPSLLEGTLKAQFDGAAVKVRDLALTTPVATVAGTADYALGKPLGQAVAAALTGTLTPAHALEKWLTPGDKDTALPKVAGTLDFAVKAAASEGPIPRVTLALVSKTLDVTLPKQPKLAVAPLALKVEAEGTEAGYALRDFALTLPYAAVTATGAFATESGRVSLEGSLTPDFAAIWGLPFMDPYREMGLAIAGKHARPFRFEAPVLTGLPGILNEGTAEASLAFDRVTLPGLDIPNGQATLTLADAQVALDAEVALNGGKVRLAPRIAVAAEPYVLTVPQGAKLLDGVGLTQAMLDAGLGAVNPLLKGSATPSGTVDVVCEALSMTLGKDPMADLTAHLRLLTHGVSLSPNGTLATVLTLLKQKDRTATLPDQDFAVRVTKGIVTCDPIDMRIGAVRVSCEGATTLSTRALDYTLTVNAPKVGDGITLALPVTGTIDKPAIETDALVRALSDAAADAAIDKASEKLSEKLSERLGKALRKKGGEEGQKAGEKAGKEAADNLENALRGLFGR